MLGGHERFQVTNRKAIEDRLWKRFPDAGKVRASNGARLIRYRGTARDLSTLSVPELFEVYSRVTLPVPA